MFHSDPHMRSMPTYVYNQTALVVTSKKASLTGPRPALLAMGQAFFQALSDTPHDGGWGFPLCLGTTIFAETLPGVPAHRRRRIFIDILGLFAPDTLIIKEFCPPPPSPTRCLKKACGGRFSLHTRSVSNLREKPPRCACACACFAAVCTLNLTNPSSLSVF